MARYSFIFHKHVYLRQEVDATHYAIAEEMALELSDSVGTTFETPYLLSYSKKLDASEQTSESQLLLD
jgi:hypothetical protein